MHPFFLHFASFSLSFCNKERFKDINYIYIYIYIYHRFILFRLILNWRKPSLATNMKIPSTLQKNTNLLPPASMIPRFHILFTPLFHFLPLFVLFHSFFTWFISILLYFASFRFIPLLFATFRIHFASFRIHFVSFRILVGPFEIELF